MVKRKSARKKSTKTKALYANVQHDTWVRLRKAALVEETTVTAILDRLVERHVKDYKL
jgi:ribosomal protein L39E